MASDNDNNLNKSSINTYKRSKVSNNNDTVTEVLSLKIYQQNGLLECQNTGKNFNNVNISSVYNNEASANLEQQIKREENPFSFKHFLNSCSTGIISNNVNNICINANAAIKNSKIIEPVLDLTNATDNNSNWSKDKTKLSPTFTNNTQPPLKATITPSALSVTASASSTTPNLYKTSTGAKPKVISSNINTSLATKYFSCNQEKQRDLNLSSTKMSTTSMSSLLCDSSEMCKMKRSPRFSSFDSQASLVEFAESNCTENFHDTSHFKNSVDLITDDRKSLSGVHDKMYNFFGDSGSNKSNRAYEFEQKDKRRLSTSNIDLDLPPKYFTSNSIDENCDLMTCSLRQLPKINSNNGVPKKPNSRNYLGSSIALGNVGSLIGGPDSNLEFSNVLPDFVQDHWMDQCYSEVNLSSPPNSQISSPVDFVENLSCGADVCNINSVSNSNLPNVAAAANACEVNSTVGIDKCQALPDFLSDAPIIHSSGRLADIAVGLPSDLDSPDINSPSIKLSRMSLENERLRRELDENRIALAEQTRCRQELERRLYEQKKQTINNICGTEATKLINNDHIQVSVDPNKNRSYNQIVKLKKQVKLLSAEVETLKRENLSLREDGAVGGGNNMSKRLSKNQISKDLKKAASVAENSLRQLLRGIDNLRVIASTIENLDRESSDPMNQTSENSSNIKNEELQSNSEDDVCNDFWETFHTF